MYGVDPDRRLGRGGPVPGLLAVAALVLVAARVESQRLLTLVPRATQPATVAAQDFGPDIAPIAVQVDLDLLRGEPGRLDLPTPDGRVLSADLSVFEDRGGGDLMWSGGLPGADHDSVVLTVEGGRLVGWFGEPGGVRYRISAGPDGSGRMAGGTGLPGPEPEAFCSVGAGPDPRLLGPAHLPAEAMAVDLPARVEAAQNHEQLDILVVYTRTAASNWADQGGARAAIRSAGDYLNMVLRNGNIGVSARIVHMAQLSGLDRVGRDGDGLYGTSIITQLRYDGEALRLRREHGADLVHLFTGESPWALGGACGQHYLLFRDETAEEFSEFAYGWTSNACSDDGPIFAHEVGHGLGAHHDPANGGSPRTAFRPYAFGHGNLDRIPNVGTIMSYTGQGEAYLSSVRVRPQGRVIGIANERENERALRESIHIGVHYGDSVEPLPENAPAAPTNLVVRMADDISVRLLWQDNAPDADGYEVTFWRSDQTGDPSTRRFEERSSAVLDLPVAGAGTRYFFFVRAVSGESTYSARSSTVTLAVPGAEPAPPSRLAWRLVAEEDPIRTGTHSASVSWVDNSDDEARFEVQLLYRGVLQRRKFVSANSESTLLTSLFPDITYSVRVFAHGATGTSASTGSLILRSPPLPGPRPVSGLTARATGATSARLTWRDNSSDETGFRVLAFVSGWYGLFEADANSESIEIEGLARGGAYIFFVLPYNEAGVGERSFTRLGLGAVGRGPAAPTGLGWGVEGGVARLTWKDNSRGETGFEIQSRPEYDTQDTTVVGGGRWTRVALVPADVTSFAFDRSEDIDYRVFAYDVSGYSRASNTVRTMPAPSGDPPEEEDGGLMVVPSGETAVELTWTGRWARAARGPLAIEARSPANGWVEVATAEPTAAGTTVVGLRSETPYTFRLRSGSADYSPEASVTTGAFRGACRQGADYLCLRDGRFEVRTHWSRPDVVEEFGAGTAVPVGISDESGLFWFFESENIELVVKVLDGRAINGSYWVFFGALSDVEYWLTVRDVETDERRTYHNPPKEVCGQKDLLAFSDMTGGTVLSGAADSTAGRPGFDLLRMNVASLDVSGVDLASDGSGHCEAGDERLCLLDDRFSVEVEFTDPNVDVDTPRAANVIPSLTTGKTGFFWFFSPSNVELAVKMLDGRGVNGRFWFLYGGLSDVEYTIAVTDTVAGGTATYRNEAGSICGEIDIEAF
ncbi:MAG: hypothetical protein F4Y77_01685 [Holophagales bacterium]|nr:hypothetical protein [Holophagales bacterium]